MRRCVSQLPIQPAAWCRLPSDKITNNSILQQPPAVFRLDNSSRCSCGYNGKYDENLKTMDPMVILYTSTIALKHSAETMLAQIHMGKLVRISVNTGFSIGIIRWGFSPAVEFLYSTAYTLRDSIQCFLSFNTR